MNSLPSCSSSLDALRFFLRIFGMVQVVTPRRVARAVAGHAVTDLRLRPLATITYDKFVIVAVLQTVIIALSVMEIYGLTVMYSSWIIPRRWQPPRQGMGVAVVPLNG